MIMVNCDTNSIGEIKKKELERPLLNCQSPTRKNVEVAGGKGSRIV